MTSRVIHAQFGPGMVVRHRLFGYRALVFDVDPHFSQSEDWYDMLSESRASREEPWYHVLVDGESHSTYVAESNLTSCTGAAAFEHPMLSHLFRVAPTSNPRSLAFEARFAVN